MSADRIPVCVYDGMRDRIPAFGGDMETSRILVSLLHMVGDKLPEAPAADTVPAVSAEPEDTCPAPGFDGRSRPVGGYNGYTQ